MKQLTKISIDRAQYEGDQKARCVFWDGQLKGFGLRVYPSGRKSFVLSYRIHGRKRLLTLGDYGLLTLEQARTMAKKRAIEVLDGRDPLQDRRNESHGETMRDLCASFIERYSKPRKKSWEEDERRFKKYILPLWGSHRVRSITREDVTAFHHRLGKNSGYEANRVLATISKLFEVAKLWGVLPVGFENPARGIEKFPERKRDRWVKPEEMPRLAKAITEEKNLYVRSAIWLYLLTGMRKSELLALRWEDVDLDQKEIRLPDTKAGRIHYVPLSEPAIRLLKNLSRVSGNPYVLPGKREGRHLVNITKPWSKIRTAAEVEDVRLHDLRRTVGSWLAQSGNSLHLIAHVLNHSNLATTKIYARFGKDSARVALDQHARRIVSLSKLGSDLGAIAPSDSPAVHDSRS